MGSCSVVAGVGWGSGDSVPCCSPPAAPDTWAVQGLGSARAVAALSLHGCTIHQPPCLPSQSAAHRTVHRCCRHSHCHHRSATGSGCSSRSGRGTRPPRTPGGLWAQSSRAVGPGRGSSAESPAKQLQCFPRDLGAYLTKRRGRRTRSRDQGLGHHFLFFSFFFFFQVLTRGIWRFPG